jgi:hypothetical protein
LLSIGIALLSSGIALLSSGIALLSSGTNYWQNSAPIWCKFVSRCFNYVSIMFQLETFCIEFYTIVKKRPKLFRYPKQIVGIYVERSAECGSIPFYMVQNAERNASECGSIPLCILYYFFRCSHCLFKYMFLS